MALVLPNGGEVIALEAFVGKTQGMNLVLGLFKSNTTPAETDVIGTYTAADFTGYSPITLTAASWSSTPDAPSNITYPQQSFTSTAGSQSQPVYGYMLMQSISGGTLAYAERFTDGPYTIVDNGDIIKVTPTITCD